MTDGSLRLNWPSELRTTAIKGKGWWGSSATWQVPAAGSWHRPMLVAFVGGAGIDWGPRAAQKTIPGQFLNGYSRQGGSDTPCSLTDRFFFSERFGLMFCMGRSCSGLESNDSQRETCSLRFTTTAVWSSVLGGARVSAGLGQAEDGRWIFLAGFSGPIWNTDNRLKRYQTPANTHNAHDTCARPSSRGHLTRLGGRDSGSDTRSDFGTLVKSGPKRRLPSLRPLGITYHTRPARSAECLQL